MSFSEKQSIKKLIITSTHNVESHRIIEYIKFESVEIVLGTGVISETASIVADAFGKRSTSFELKMHQSKEIALKQLMQLATECGADAIVGLDLDYTEFDNNVIAVIVSGTFVKLKKYFESKEDELLSEF